MPFGRSHADVRTYLARLLPILERFRDLQARGAAQAKVDVARLQAAAPGPERAAVAEQLQAAQEGEREELTRIAAALRSLAPPSDFAPVHEILVRALGQSLEAHAERAAARRLRDKEGLATARRRQQEAIERWEQAGRELRSRGGAIK